jgi:hypothetical protein
MILNPNGRSFIIVCFRHLLQETDLQEFSHRAAQSQQKFLINGPFTLVTVGII